MQIPGIDQDIKIVIKLLSRSTQIQIRMLRNVF